MVAIISVCESQPGPARLQPPWCRATSCRQPAPTPWMRRSSAMAVRPRRFCDNKAAQHALTRATPRLPLRLTSWSSSCTWRPVQSLHR
eukprot:342047-Heterocapsa_arctica.AAC.1